MYLYQGSSNRPKQYPFLPLRGPNQVTLTERQGLVRSGNTKGGSINVLLTPCLTGLDQSVLQIKLNIVSCHTADSKPVKQEVSSTVILPPLVFPGTVELHIKVPCFVKKYIMFPLSNETDLNQFLQGVQLYLVFPRIQPKYCLGQVTQRHSFLQQPQTQISPAAWVRDNGQCTVYLILCLCLHATLHLLQSYMVGAEIPKVLANYIT